MGSFSVYSIDQEWICWDTWITSWILSPSPWGTSWNLGSRDQAVPELRAQSWHLSFVLSLKAKAILSPAPASGQPTWSLPTAPWGSRSSNFWKLSHCPWGLLEVCRHPGLPPRQCVCVCVYFSSLPVKRTLAVSDGGWTGGLEDHFSTEFRPAWADLPWV